MADLTLRLRTSSETLLSCVSSHRFLSVVGCQVSCHAMFRLTLVALLSGPSSIDVLACMHA